MNPESTPASPRPATHPTIFIVDDDDSARNGLALLVRSAGWQCEAFASARDFLVRPAFSGIGCLVLDVCMPEMTGLELRDLIATRDAPLPIVFLTGHGDLPMGVDAMKKGAVDFLQKPVDDEALLEAVRRAVERHAAAQSHLRRLTPRERQVLEYVIGGNLNKQIAAELRIAERTVKIFRANVMQKMGVNSVAELVRQCEAAGLTPRVAL